MLTTKYLTLATVLMLALSNPVVHADDIPVITEETTIARGTTRALEFSTAPPKDTTVLLEVTSRIAAKTLSGSNLVLGMKLNGRTIDDEKSRPAHRLKNRAFESPITHNLSAPWYGPQGWRVLYAPAYDKPPTYYEGDPYMLVLDITDLINPAAKNRLEVTNTVTARVATAIGTDAELLIRSLKIKTVPGLSPLVAKTNTILNEIPVIATQTVIPRTQTRAFEFGTVPQQNTTVLLEVTSRLDAKTLSGSSFFLRLMLNGHEVKAAKSRNANRLKNRAFVSPVAVNLPSTWFGSPAGWRVLYAPDFEGGRKQTFYEGDPYTLVLDITDLTNPAAENRLEITNTAQAGAATYGQSDADLVIDKLTIKTLSQPSPMMAAGEAIKPFINRGQRAGGPAKYTGRILPGGGFSVTVGNREWKFASAYSYPNAGFNRLDRAQSGQPGWSVQSKGYTSGGQVTAQGKEYSINRSVKFTPRKIEVSDAITNKTNAPLGLIVRHETDLSGLENPPVRLTGSTDPALSEYHSPGNPSVHITAPGHALAMLCEDDVFRNQVRLYVREGADNAAPAAGLRTEMLRLAPGETYALQWSVYPVDSQDYFDFINLARQDWGSNFTVEGAWWWGFDPNAVIAMPLEELRERLNRQGIRYATIGGGWVDRTKDPKRIGFGTGVMDSYWDDYRRRVREAGDKLRQAVPGLKVMAYYDSQRDTSEGGHERFKDSWLTNTQGQQLSTEWSGQYSLTYSTVATLDNSYGKAMLETARRYMDEMKLDGIYWDEMENVGYNAPLLTYNIADGHSAIIDPQTYTIQREVGNTALLGEGHRLAVIDIVQKRGGVLLGNGPAGTKALLRTGIQRMVESQHNDYWTYEGHLGTPLGYISGYTKWENYRRVLSMAALPVAIGIHQDHDISRHLFPFTPIELHYGYMLGKERIITLHDGNFGWDGKFRYRLWVYDGTGKAVNENPAWQSGENRVPVQVPENGVVVMEREL